MFTTNPRILLVTYTIKGVTHCKWKTILITSLASRIAQTVTDNKKNDFKNLKITY